MAYAAIAIPSKSYQRKYRRRRIRSAFQEVGNPELFPYKLNRSRDRVVPVISAEVAGRTSTIRFKDPSAPAERFVLPQGAWSEYLVHVTKAVRSLG
jgi:hypothetical protein